MRFKNLLLAMTMLALPSLTYAGSSTVWEKEVMDPATGGVQLVGAKVLNVQEGYSDTLPGEGSSGAKRRGTGSRVSQAETEQQYAERMKKEQKERDEAEAEARDRMKTLGFESDVIKDLVIEAQRDSSKKLTAMREALKKLEDCVLFCGKEKEEFDKAADELRKANALFDAYYDAYQKDQESIGLEKAFLEGIEQDRERNKQALADAEKSAAETRDKVTDADRELILSEIGGANTDDWEVKMTDRYERGALQQKLDQMEMLYGTGHYDLSKPEDQKKAKQLINLLNGKDPNYEGEKTKLTEDWMKSQIQ